MTARRDEDAAAGAKRRLRAEVLRRRESLAPETRAALSERILRRVAALDAYRRSATVLAYSSFGSELDTGWLVRHALSEGKTLMLPRIDRERRRLDLYRVRDPERDLLPGVWGIREPDPARCDRISPDEVGFVLVPGVAFDPRGGRLGYGGGFYDRLLSKDLTTHPPLVAAAFEVQMVPEIPLDEHDVLIDLVITESSTYPPDHRLG